MRLNTVCRGRNTAIAAVLLAATLQPCRSVADGALAVGLPANVSRDGFADGNLLNAKDMDAAREGAMRGCKNSIGASEAARKLCKVVATFHNQCFAVAIDPKDGTPGVGWSVADTLAMADKQAIEQCRTTAGPERREFCVVVEGTGINHGCDGNAK